MLETGLNRYNKQQIEEDLTNQSKARFTVLRIVDLDIDIETQDTMSFWDWEFFRNGKIIAIGEYRRRFCNFGVFQDFQFSYKKFKAMTEKANMEKIPAYMFVEFNDCFLYFNVEGNPPRKIMKRNHEIRTEECVCISNDLFKSVSEFMIDIKFFQLPCV
jgi:hypothetical protein